MINFVLHKAATRGHVNFEWLTSYHTFSFGNYHNPSRINFGALRVLNDDIIGPGMGFPAHPHSNMEIITIPLEGDLEHQDSMGNKTVIREGDVQVMSAGTRITHSEYNKNADKPVMLLQIWIIPNKNNVTPRYDQISLKNIEKQNEFYQILSPNPDDAGVWIYQNAWFHYGKFNENLHREYTLKNEGNGMYIFVIEGCIEVNDISLEKRDGIGFWNLNSLTIKTLLKSTVLIMEVPMKI